MREMQKMSVSISQNAHEEEGEDEEEEEKQYPPRPGVRGVHSAAALRDACGSGGGKAHRCYCSSPRTLHNQTRQLHLAARRTKEKWSRGASLLPTAGAGCCSLMDGSLGQSGAGRVERFAARSQSQEGGG
ncbi:unnamed protein product [Pleuronectes platessa]|uniref:Uncharacterized protein n=1 Tax=Pleuronectes platessa TaxID=8262 RepID=A0A9N7U5P7_PLEPL|nr:unnamed protein product [Pleuronectes platessa]